MANVHAEIPGEVSEEEVQPLEVMIRFGGLGIKDFSCWINYNIEENNSFGVPVNYSKLSTQACKTAGWIHVIILLISGIFTVNTMLTY